MTFHQILFGTKDQQKNFVGQVHFAQWAFCRGRVKLIGYR